MRNDDVGNAGISLIVGTTIAGDPGLLHPEEAACLSANAVPSRRREFAAGRVAATQAMRALGLQPMPVRMAEDRSPVWPEGVVGSISHSRSLAAAAVARSAGSIRAVGLDIEEAEGLDAGLIGEICLGPERAWLEMQPLEDRGLLAKAIFSAKEAAYKCQYPLTRAMFGFEVIEIDLQMAQGRFFARFTDEVGPFRRGDVIRGKVGLGAGHIVSLAVLR